MREIALQEMISEFALDGQAVQCIPFGSGHINLTWLVETDRAHRYILQKVNTGVFPNGTGLMNNIILVTEHLRKKDPDPRHVLTLVPAKDGRLFISRGENEIWRVYEFVTGGISLNRAETPEDLRLSGLAFGQFQRQMADFPAEKLVEVIPGFHDTPRRYLAFHKALREDQLNRAGKAGPEIDFILRREETAGLLMNLLRQGMLPLRVTHNDTKLNNVMLDEQTRQPLCILDLDTVMPGLVANDFGESVRFGASTADEDEPDTGKVHVDLGLYEFFARGFLDACGDQLTDMEKETLADGARMMSLENGMRFLTDYLEGDTYFHIARPEHNLERCRAQLALVREMEEKEERIRKMIREIIRN